MLEEIITTPAALVRAIRDARDRRDRERRKHLEAAALRSRG